MSTGSETASSKADFIRLVEEGRELNSVALDAELKVNTALSEGLEETRTALGKLYELCFFLSQQDDDTREKLFANQKYINADGDESLVPYGKPAREKPEVPAAKIVMQRRDAGTLSKVALICRSALAANVLCADFSNWLMNEHYNADGSSTGRGIEGAYQSYRAPRGTTGNRVSGAASNSARSLQTSNSVPDNQIKDLITEAFKSGLTTKWDLKVPNENVHHEVYSVLVKVQGAGLVTLVCDRVPLTALIERLQNVIQQQKIKPADWKAMASGAAEEKPVDAPTVADRTKAEEGTA